MDYKKGDVVIIKDNNGNRKGIVTSDGMDSKKRVKVRPENFPIDIYITTEVNDNLYIIKLHGE